MIAVLLTAVALIAPVSVAPGYQGDQAHPRASWSSAVPLTASQTCDVTIRWVNGYPYVVGPDSEGARIALVNGYVYAICSSG
jgi:hypothetical protein